MSTQYAPDDYDLLVFVDKLRDRVAFRGRIDRRRPTVWDEIRSVDTAYVAIHLLVLGGFLGTVAMLLSAPS
jgi:hypothetical protein